MASVNSSAVPTVKVVTLNCWGLWMVAKRRKQRMLAIGSWLKTTDADVVLLQEVFLQSDVAALTSSAKDGGLVHSRSFEGGVLGGELLTLSRYPISKTHFVQYSVAGDPAKPHHGDFFAGKGFGYTRLELSDNLSVDIFNTHTCANYSHRRLQLGAVQLPLDADGPVRLAQLFQLAHYVASVAGPHVVLAGDLNSPPDSLEMAMLRLLLPALEDPWLQLRPSDSGFTANARNNNFTKIPGDPPLRIDYVMLKGIAAQRVEAFDRCCSDNTSFSDHIGVSADLVLPQQRPPLQPISADISISSAKQLNEIADESLSIVRQGVQRYATGKRLMLGTSGALVAVALSSAGLVIAFSRRRQHPAVVPVLVMLQLLAAVLAALLFVVGFAGYGSTHHALQQTQDEMSACFSGGVCH